MKLKDAPKKILVSMENKLNISKKYIKNGRNMFYSLFPDYKDDKAYLSREYYRNNAPIRQNSLQICVNYC